MPSSKKIAKEVEYESEEEEVEYEDAEEEDAEEEEEVDDEEEVDEEEVDEEEEVEEEVEESESESEEEVVPVKKAKKVPAKKVPAKKAAPAKKTPTKKAAPAKKTPTKKAAPAKKGAVTGGSTSARGRREKLDKAQLNGVFVDLKESIKSEVQRCRIDKDRPTPIGYLRTLNSQINQLQKDVGRSVKGKTKRETNPNGGFNQVYPVHVKLTAFMGRKKGDLVSRADAQRAICGYVKTKELANPEKRSEIRPDAKLADLLSFKEADAPLTYPGIVRLMQARFPNKEESARIREERKAAEAAAVEKAAGKKTPAKKVVAKKVAAKKQAN
jgi:chromatin remodeling complex protein RSC6